MRKKEDCTWCMSTQHIERKIGSGQPEEFKFRCSACHELWNEENRECDGCTNNIDTEEPSTYTYDQTTHTFMCLTCCPKENKDEPST